MTLPWTPDHDPASIPDEVILRERGRRNQARVKVRRGGPKKKPTKCRICGHLCESARAAQHCKHGR